MTAAWVGLALWCALSCRKPSPADRTIGQLVTAVRQAGPFVSLIGAVWAVLVCALLVTGAVTMWAALAVREGADVLSVLGQALSELPAVRPPALPTAPIPVEVA